jgi:hypothetical protein
MKIANCLANASSIINMEFRQQMNRTVHYANIPVARSSIYLKRRDNTINSVFAGYEIKIWNIKLGVANVVCLYIFKTFS